ncbi:hypothetical protein CP8484711_1772A, partial [Chlamydia psittaci 84-8471/1]
MCSIQ